MDVQSLTLRTLVGTLNGTLNVFVGGAAHHSLRWTLGPVSAQRLLPIGPGAIPMLQLTDTQQCPLMIQALDAKGHPASIDETSARWTTSDPAVATVAGTGLSATLLAGDPGSTQVNVTVDADLGDGVRTISGTLDVTVVAGAAVALGVQTGVPTDQPAAAPSA